MTSLDISQNNLRLHDGDQEIRLVCHRCGIGHGLGEHCDFVFQPDYHHLGDSPSTGSEDSLFHCSDCDFTTVDINSFQLHTTKHATMSSTPPRRDSEFSNPPPPPPSGSTIRRDDPSDEESSSDEECLGLLEQPVEIFLERTRSHKGGPPAEPHKLPPEPRPPKRRHGTAFAKSHISISTSSLLSSLTDSAEDEDSPKRSRSEYPFSATAPVLHSEIPISPLTLSSKSASSKSKERQKIRKCPRCGVVCVGSAQIQSHQRAFHQEQTFLTWPDGTKSIVYRENAFFHCICVKYCGYEPHRSPEKIRAHSKICKGFLRFKAECQEWPINTDAPRSSSDVPSVGESSLTSGSISTVEDTIEEDAFELRVNPWKVAALPSSAIYPDITVCRCTFGLPNLEVDILDWPYPRIPCDAKAPSSQDLMIQIDYFKFIGCGRVPEDLDGNLGDLYIDYTDPNRPIVYYWSHHRWFQYNNLPISENQPSPLLSHPLFTANGVKLLVNDQEGIHWSSSSALLASENSVNPQGPRILDMERLRRAVDEQRVQQTPLTALRKEEELTRRKNHEVQSPSEPRPPQRPDSSASMYVDDLAMAKDLPYGREMSEEIGHPEWSPVLPVASLPDIIYPHREVNKPFEGGVSRSPNSSDCPSHSLQHRLDEPNERTVIAEGQSQASIAEVAQLRREAQDTKKLRSRLNRSERSLLDAQIQLEDQKESYERQIRDLAASLKIAEAAQRRLDRMKMILVPP